MQTNSGITITLPQDCHDLISAFMAKHQNGKLNEYNLERVSQEVTQKVIGVMCSIYDIFDSMHNVLYTHEYESNFFFPETEKAHFTLSEIDLINQIARRIFHGSVEVVEVTTMDDTIYPFKICKSIFHEEIFKMTARSECTVKCTMNLEHDQILRPQDFLISRL